ncbi:MAG TPA: hypothetical protein VKQ36_08830 [Ktedonobacterales bacterium]|nr:hypothetical protein [Ktedonobacterales bacterium]
MILPSVGPRLLCALDALLMLLRSLRGAAGDGGDTTNTSIVWLASLAMGGNLLCP